MANINACLTFDFDAMSSWISGYRTRSPNALSRGEFGKVGAQRILDLLSEYDIKGTWFVPGHTAEAFPEVTERIASEGHEIGHHGYCHENPAPMELDEEEAILVKGCDILEKVTGSRPKGYRCPSGSFSDNTLNLLRRHGFEWDSSMLGDDYTPYYCRVGHEAPIDAPYVFGEPIEIVEIPFSWSLDDHPFFEHTRSKRGVNPGLASPSHVYEVWSADFDYLFEKLGEGVFTLTMHPQVIGRGHRMLMLEELIDYISRHAGVQFTTVSEYVDGWKQRNPFAGAQSAATDPIRGLPTQ